MEGVLKKFKPRVLSTGVRELDEMMGGGLLDDSTLLVIYDASSFGWTVGVQVFRRIIESGGFGVVTSYSFPVSLLEKYALTMHYDVLREGSVGNLAIIDVIGSLYSLNVDLPFVYYPGSIDSETFLAKMETVYRRILTERSGGRKPVGISVTIDALPDLFGEEVAMRILRRSLVMKEMALMREERARPINIFLLNRERASRRFIEWLSQYAEHIIEFKPTSIPGVEKMIARKSLLPEFTPSEAEFRFKHGNLEIRPL